MRIKLILLLSNSADVTGSRKSKMLAAKPEILIHQLVSTIATKIQRLRGLPNVFGVQEHDRTNMNTFRFKQKWEIKYGGHYSEVDMENTIPRRRTVFRLVPLCSSTSK